MIHGPHRTKGGAPQLGASPGQPGPYGAHEEDPAAAALRRLVAAVRRAQNASQDDYALAPPPPHGHRAQAARAAEEDPEDLPVTHPRPEQGEIKSVLPGVPPTQSGPPPEIPPAQPRTHVCCTTCRDRTGEPEHHSVKP